MSGTLLRDSRTVTAGKFRVNIIDYHPTTDSLHFSLGIEPQQEDDDCVADVSEDDMDLTEGEKLLDKENM